MVWRDEPVKVTVPGPGIKEPLLFQSPFTSSVEAPEMVREAPLSMVISLTAAPSVPITGNLAIPPGIKTIVDASGTDSEHQLPAVFQFVLMLPNQVALPVLQLS